MLESRNFSLLLQLCHWDINLIMVSGVYYMVKNMWQNYQIFTTKGKLATKVRNLRFGQPIAHQSFGNFSVFPIRFHNDFWPLKAVMSDCCDLKCEQEFSKFNDSYFQHLGVIKITKSSSNLAIYFRMRFSILVHCVLACRSL